MPVQAHRLGDLPADAEDRVERGHWVLEDHRDPVAAELLHASLRQVRELDPVEAHRPVDDPSRGLQQSHDAERGDRLPAPGLADDAEDLAGTNVERDALDGLDGAAARREVGVQVADLQQRLAQRGRRRRHLSRTRSRSSDGVDES